MDFFVLNCSHSYWFLCWILQLGNPETCDAEDWRGLTDYAWSHAVVSDETHKIIRENCDFYSANPWSNHNCSDAVDVVLDQYKEIDMYSIYTSVCTKTSDDKSMQVLFQKTSKMVSDFSFLNR